MSDEARLDLRLQTKTIDKRILWSWGANNYGQLGVGNKNDMLIPSVQVPISLEDESVRVKSCEGGGGFSVILTDCGRIFTCGNNDRGQLGQGHKETLILFTPCIPLTKIKITKVAAGWDFILGITDTGTLLSWGSNSFGQLGRPLSSGTFDAFPGEVSGLTPEKQIDIAAGLRHAISLSDSGKVHTWGHGKKDQLASQQKLSNSPFPISVTIPEVKKVVQVVAGMYHSAALTDTGTVHLWGCNKYGQCCQDPLISTTVVVPTKSVFPTEEEREGIENKVVSVSSGWTHMIARTSLGQVYSWGRADLGQLGRVCDKPYDHIPKLVEGLKNVTSFACGSEHNLALTEDGCVYSWGWNEHGICGTGDEANVMYPQKIEAFNNKCVVNIGCGAGHSFCMLKDS